MYTMDNIDCFSTEMNLSRDLSLMDTFSVPRNRQNSKEPDATFLTILHHVNFSFLRILKT